MEPLTPPPGGDQTRAPTVVGVYTAMTALGLMCLSARLYTRFALTRTPGWDDFVLTFTMVGLIIPNLIFGGIQTHYGLGRHEYYLTAEQALKTVKYNFIGNPFGILAVCVPKLAVVIFIHKILGKTHRIAVSILYVMATTNIIVSIIDIFILFFQCDPPDTPWNPNVKVPNCWNPHILVDFTFFVGSYSAFIDLVLALYPATFIWKLKIRTQQKLALTVVMGLGVLACACAIVRTSTLKSLLTPVDSTWRSAYQIIWAGAEANVIVICASIPALLPLFQQVTGRKDYRSRSSRSRGQDGHMTDDSRNALRTAAVPMDTYKTSIAKSSMNSPSGSSRGSVHSNEV